MLRTIFLSWVVAISAACAASDLPGSTPDPDTHHEMLLSEARGDSLALASSGLASTAERTTSDRRDFHRRLVGLWHVKTFQQTPDGSAQAWVDLYWIIGRQYAMHVVTLYADEALTVPLLRWDLIRGYELEGPSSEVPEAYDLTWTDQGSWLTAYVDHPALLGNLGVADCNLQVGKRRSTRDNCGAPLFPFRDCPLMDFAQLAGGKLTFGDPLSNDRCIARANRFEAFSFDRVPLPRAR
jgi:hypothetical protein